MADLTVRLWVSKRAGETDWRGVNWKTELVEGESITGYNFELPDDSDITLVDKKIYGMKTFAYLSGGSPGVTVDIVGCITTDSTPPRRLELLLKLPVT